MFNKEKTPYERREIAQKEIDKACKKRDKLDKYKNFIDDYEIKRNILTRKIAKAIKDRELAEHEIKNPAPVPKTNIVDNSKRININTDIALNSKNKASIEAHGHYHSSKDKASSSNNKYPNKKQTEDENKINLKTLIDYRLYSTRIISSNLHSFIDCISCLIRYKI